LTPVYDPKTYWSTLVGERSTVVEVGHHLMGAYNHVAYRRRKKAFLKALSYCSVTGQASVFEAGFGSGFYLNVWRGLGVRRLTGVDLSPRAVAGAKSRFPEYALLCGDISEPLAVDTNFDVVTALDVLYHIVDDDRWQMACLQLCDLVKPGGHLVFTDKFPRNRAYQAFPHVRRRPLEWYDSVLADKRLFVKQVIPVFLLMDDALPVGKPTWLAKAAFVQWRAVAKGVRSLKGWPVARDALGYAIAILQLPIESIGIALLRRTPNLEIVVATKEA
jgi:SAM-dependent methyltransferase